MGEHANVLVTAVGGFIGHHPTRYRVGRGYSVHDVDVKFTEFGPSPLWKFRILDLRRWEKGLDATRDMDHVYHLAANIGGIGFIEANKAAIVHDNSLINTHNLEQPGSLAPPDSVHLLGLHLPQLPPEHL